MGELADVVVRWTDWKYRGMEHCLFRSGQDGLSLQGVVAGTRGGWYGASYEVQTNAEGTTVSVKVSYVGGPSLFIMSDGQGSWCRGESGEALPELEGVLDVDIGVTPATNALPIRRLGLSQGQIVELRAAYVPLASEIGEGAFAARAVEQRYTCLAGGRRYLYEGIFRHFRAVLEIDDNGLVLDYPATFRRVLPPSERD